MVQPPAMPHPTKSQPYNPSVFPSGQTRMNDNQQSSLTGMNSHSTANKMSHHSQEMHGFYNNQQSNYGGNNHQFGNNGAGSSSTANNFYNMGHYSVSSNYQSQVSLSYNCSCFFSVISSPRHSSNSNKTGTNNSNISDKYAS